MRFSIILKSVVATLLLVFAGIGSTTAVPSYPNPVKVKQADGTTITVRLYGDERFNYATTVDGYQVVAKKGIYYYATLTGTQLVSTGVKAKEPIQRGAEDTRVLRNVQRGVPYAAASAAAMRDLSSPVMFGASGDNPQLAAYNQKMLDARSSGEQFKSLVILVDFTDKGFSISDPKSAFDRMLNEEGYSDNQATGSARDYYFDNSNGKFNPHFDVVGVFTLPKTVSGYVGHEVDFVIDACNLAQSNGVDFSPYVSNGVLQDVFIFYAGYNNAEVGGNIYLHPARISYVGGYPLGSNLNPVPTWGCGKLYAAAYTSELKGASGTTMAGIGTFCHEFGHILGWPDFYDTDYEQNGTGFNLDIFSLMASGSYVNSGKTPPAISAYERYMVKWAELTEITQAGEYVLEPIYNDKCFMIKTFNDGEIFIFEYRNGNLNKWDKFLSDGNSSTGTAFPAYGGGSGMLVYHIDRSENRIGFNRASDLWNMGKNQVNAFGNHECMSLVMAAKVQRSGGVLRDFGKMFFPGSNNVTQFTSADAPYFLGWDGYTTGWDLYNIKQNGSANVTFEVKKVQAGGIKDFTVKTGQANIAVTFASPFRDKYTVKCQEVGGTALFTTTTEERAVNFSGLKTGTKYLITIANEVSEDVIESKEVTTETPDPNKVPSLTISGLYTKNNYIILGYRNVQSEVKSVKWTVDGQEYKEVAFKLPSKSGYKIMAQITTVDGVEYLVKYVTVN